MPARTDHPALDRAHALALTWLASLDERAVPPGRDGGRGGGEARHGPSGRPDGPRGRHRPPGAAVRARAHRDAVGPLLRLRHRRHPSRRARRRLAASARGTRTPACAPSRPAHSAVEDIAEAWLLDLLGLPPRVPSASSPAARWPTSPAWPPAATRCSRRAGWDVATRGLVGSPGVRVLVGAERHDTVDLALRYLGLGAPGAGRRRRPGPHRARRAARRARAGRRPARRSSCSRRATSTRARSTRSPRRSTWPTRTARGCTSTARSACSPAPRRARATSSPASRPPTPGPPTPTRPSTCPTTAGSPSCAIGQRCVPRWACTATT